MLIFISGNDNFLASGAINQIKAKYKAKNPDGAELIEIAPDSVINWADLQAVPLFATSRLVIMRSVGKFLVNNQENLAYFLKNLPETTVVVVWDDKELPAKSVLAEAITKNAKQTILAAPLIGSALQKHIAKRAQVLGVKITPDLTNHIIENCGSDLWAIENELVYLSNSSDGALSNNVKKIEVEKFASYRLVKSMQWQKLAEHIKDELNSGMEMPIILGGLAGAIRQNLSNSPLKRDLTNLLMDVDVGIKTGLLDDQAAIALLAFYLPNPAQKRVQWERVWEEVTF
jgi:DNA polymerase III delta subunit